MERRTKRATPRRPLHRNRQTLSPIWRANKISLCNPSLEIDADQIGWPRANARAHGAPSRGWLLGNFISRLYRPVAVTPRDIDVTILNGTPSFSFSVFLYFFRYHSRVSLLTRFRRIVWRFIRKFSLLFERRLGSDQVPWKARGSVDIVRSYFNEDIYLRLFVACWPTNNLDLNKRIK